MPTWLTGTVSDQGVISCAPGAAYRLTNEPGRVFPYAGPNGMSFADYGAWCGGQEDCASPQCAQHHPEEPQLEDEGFEPERPFW